ncbi:MAG: enoyl-CoA hydratase/isomerase family protein, partial [Rhizobiaceae bacterium]
MANSDDIWFERRGRAGVITLAKPETLNAVTDAMLTAIVCNLDDWENDPVVERVIIKAVEGRAFSAGGDIRHLYERGVAGEYDFDFFAREYALNVRIHHFPKPYIALIDGIAMGGGVGVSFHGSHTVAGDSIAFAMPECGIGFFPDVGGSYLLSRLPGHFGLYLGLTGSRIKQTDCVATGLASHACRSKDFGALENELCSGADLNEVLSFHSVRLGVPPYETELPWIDDVFSAGSVEDILEQLEAVAKQNEPQASWAAKTLETLSQKSPTSLKVAFEQIKRGANLSMADCMRMEYRILH